MEALKWKRKAILLLFALIFTSRNIHADVKFEIDDARWISIGAGFRTSFTSIENTASGDNRLSDLDLDHARILINGQLHKYLKLEFNTECVFCNDRTLRDYDVLDGIVKSEFHPIPDRRAVTFLNHGNICISGKNIASYLRLSFQIFFQLDHYLSLTFPTVFPWACRSA